MPGRGAAPDPHDDTAYPGRPSGGSWELGAALERFDFWGWILFLVCALLFGAAGLRDGDVLITVGSVVFLVACVLFLIPHLRR